jgi:hypothetical protein
VKQFKEYFASKQPDKKEVDLAWKLNKSEATLKQLKKDHAKLQLMHQKAKKQEKAKLPSEIGGSFLLGGEQRAALWDEVLSGAEAANELREQLLAVRMEHEEEIGDRELVLRETEAKDLEIDQLKDELESVVQDQGEV